MSVNFVDGNIFSRLSTNKTTYICQQVNCKGVMGAGLAMQICIQWPVVYRRYLEFCYGNDGNKLGTYQEVLVEPKLYVVNKEELDVKDITILLARKLLKDSRIANSTVQKSKDNKAMFDNFFEKNNSIDFYRWLDSLIKSNNQWSDGYPNNFIGWHLFKYNGKSIALIQEQEDESNPYDNYINCQYRINPIYYSDFCKYFETYIRPQM